MAKKLNYGDHGILATGSNIKVLRKKNKTRKKKTQM
jgi:hypothetical protein